MKKKQTTMLSTLTKDDLTKILSYWAEGKSINVLLFGSNMTLYTKDKDDDGTEQYMRYMFIDKYNEEDEDCNIIACVDTDIEHVRLALMRLETQIHVNVEIHAHLYAEDAIDAGHVFKYENCTPFVRPMTSVVLREPVCFMTLLLL
jgi:hypothetical protein